MKSFLEESNHTKKYHAEAIQDMNISNEDLVRYNDDKLINFEVVFELKQEDDMFRRDDFYCSLMVNKVLDTLINLEVTTKFKIS